MQLSSILSACARNGVTVTQPRDRKDYYVLRKGDKVLDFFVNSDGYVGHLTEHSPQTDVMRDCFCDYFCKTVKNAMQILNPTGELVTPAKPVVNKVDTVEEITITNNEEKGGIEIRFPNKPSQEIINQLHHHCFRFSYANMLWYKRYTHADADRIYSLACEICLPKVQV